MIPQTAARHLVDAENLSGKQLDWSSVGAYKSFIDDCHDLILDALAEDIEWQANHYPNASWERSICRAQYAIIQSEQNDRRRGDLPWFMRPNEKREQSIEERCALVHQSWAIDRFIREELGIELRRNRCRCPVHDGDSTQSFSVRNNRGKCFVCGWGGDVISLAQEVWGLGRPIDAIKRLEEA